MESDRFYLALAKFPKIPSFPMSLCIRWMPRPYCGQDEMLFSVFSERSQIQFDKFRPSRGFHNKQVMKVSKPLMKVCKPVMKIRKLIMKAHQPVMKARQPVMKVRQPVMKVRDLRYTIRTLI